MGLYKGKTEGGSGGKLGHSNMDHWVTTEEIKESTRKRRRLEEKREVREDLGGTGLSQYFCERCEADWEGPSIPDLALRSNVRAELRSGRQLQGIAQLRAVGFQLRAAKAVVLHLSAADHACHRCFSSLPPSSAGEPVQCAKCRSLNFDW